MLVFPYTLEINQKVMFHIFKRERVKFTKTFTFPTNLSTNVFIQP